MAPPGGSATTSRRRPHRAPRRAATKPAPQRAPRPRWRAVWADWRRPRDHRRRRDRRVPPHRDLGRSGQRVHGELPPPRGAPSLRALGRPGQVGRGLLHRPRRPRLPGPHERRRRRPRRSRLLRVRASLPRARLADPRHDRRRLRAQRRARQHHRAGRRAGGDVEAPRPRPRGPGRRRGLRDAAGLAERLLPRGHLSRIGHARGGDAVVPGGAAGALRGGGTAGRRRRGGKELPGRPARGAGHGGVVRTARPGLVARGPGPGVALPARG